MHAFRYRDNRLYCEELSVQSLADHYATPLYVYSGSTFTGRFGELTQAMDGLDHQISYSVKSNSNLAVLRLLANLGSGFDIVSEGELRRVLTAGGSAQDCVFAGVGKTEREIDFALEQGIYCLNAESEPELEQIGKIAGRRQQSAPVAVRVNPDVEAGTHAKITTGTYENKFGIAYEEIEGVYARAAESPNLSLRGVQMHIGSQLTDVAPFEKAVQKVVPLVRKLAERYPIEFFSIGGGLGIVYDSALQSGSADWWQSPEAAHLLTPQRYADALKPLLKPLGMKILLEPGRFIAGNAGILVTRVLYVKRTGNKNFVIVDAAMNDLIRPAFYEAYHEIVPLADQGREHVPTDVVGPVCESGDLFCQDRPLPKVEAGDYLAILSAGAYSMVMASNYNSRPFPPEVLVQGDQSALIRARQPIEEIWHGERIPPSLLSPGGQKQADKAASLR